MKSISRDFKIKNLRNIFLSATVGIIPCLFLQERSFIIYGVLYLYLAFPLLVIFFGGKTKTLKKNKLFSIKGRPYTRRQLEIALFTAFISVFMCIFLKALTENRLIEILPSNLIFCLPFLTYHAFCAVFSHPLSLLKGFVLLKGRGGYVPYNPHFPSSQSFHSTDYNFSSSADINDISKPFGYYNNPISVGYIHRD